MRYLILMALAVAFLSACEKESVTINTDDSLLALQSIPPEPAGSNYAHLNQWPCITTYVIPDEWCGEEVHVEHFVEMLISLSEQWIQIGCDILPLNNHFVCVEIIETPTTNSLGYVLRMKLKYAVIEEQMGASLWLNTDTEVLTGGHLAFWHSDWFNRGESFDRSLWGVVPPRANSLPWEDLDQFPNISLRLHTNKAYVSPKGTIKDQTDDKHK